MVDACQYEEDAQQISKDRLNLTQHNHRIVRGIRPRQ
jgi:hypothetical protein